MAWIQSTRSLFDQIDEQGDLFADVQLGRFEPRCRPADQLDPDPEKPQTGANWTPPRVNAELVEGARVVIGEFEYRAARLSAVGPRDPSGRHRLVTRIPGRV